MLWCNLFGADPGHLALLCGQMCLSDKRPWDVTALESAVQDAHEHRSQLHHVLCPEGCSPGLYVSKQGTLSSQHPKWKEKKKEEEKAKEHDPW